MLMLAHSGNPATIWTIGHSTRPLGEFLGLLAGSRIEAIADVRSFPGSRKYPQYGKEALVATLTGDAIGYHCLNASLRGYADYMASAEFAQGLRQLLDLAIKARTAMMCAEAVWWRCHRSMIADALCVRGIEVVHILDAKHSVLHPMTAPARIVRGALSYAAAERE